MAAVLLLLASAAGAQEAAPGTAPAAAPARPPGYHAHDGLYVQLDLGFGVAGSKAAQGGGTLGVSGAGGQLGIGLGGAVTASLLVGGRLFGYSIGSPSVKLDGVDLGNLTGNAGLSGVGLDLVYYLVPSNFYLGLTPALTQLVVADGDGDVTSSDVGFGLRLAVGLERWVSANWALGLNVEYVLSSNRKDFGPESLTFRTSWLGLNLSASYN